MAKGPVKSRTPKPGSAGAKPPAASPPAAVPAEAQAARAKPGRLGLSESGSANAPFIYFEEASAFGHLNGVIRVTLEAVRTFPGPAEESVSLDRVITAHLRMNLPAARSLRAALDRALLMAAPVESKAKN